MAYHALENATLDALWKDEAAKRRIWVYQEIDDRMAVAVAAQIKLNAQEEVKAPKPIDLFLNTCGGSAAAMMAIVTAIEQSPVPVNVTGSGWVVSAGVPILAAGAKRTVSAHTQLLFHGGARSIGGWNKQGALEDELTQLQMVNAWIVNYLAQRTKQKAAWWQEKLETDRDWWFGPQEALEWGLVDEVLTVPVREEK